MVAGMDEIHLRALRTALDFRDSLYQSVSDTHPFFVPNIGGWVESLERNVRVVVSTTLLVQDGLVLKSYVTTTMYLCLSIPDTTIKAQS